MIGIIPRNLFAKQAIVAPPLATNPHVGRNKKERPEGLS